MPRKRTPRKNPPSIDLWVDDFLGGTAEFTAQEVGIYFRFLLYQFTHGGLPEDPEMLMRIAARGRDFMDPDFQKPVGFVLSQKFTQKGPLFVNERMDFERRKAMKRYRASVANGSKGGRPRKLHPEKQKPSENLGVNQWVSVGLTQTKPSGKEEVEVLNKSSGEETKSSEGNKPKTPPKPKKPAVAGADVDLVIRAYCQYHPRARTGEQERKLIRDRLREGYSTHDLIDAIDGIHRSPFHLGKNDTGRKHLGLSLIMRDADHVRGYIDLLSSIPPPRDPGALRKEQEKHVLESQRYKFIRKLRSGKTPLDEQEKLIREFDERHGTAGA
jgi:uncharacterized protein YdaU (DUF1376 family)